MSVEARDLREVERMLSDVRKAVMETMDLIALGRAALRRVWIILEDPEGDRDGER